MAGAMNHYETLGVSPDADKDAIRRAYRKAMQRAHPDANPETGGDEAAAKALTVAYGVLGDREKRARYDRGEDPDGDENTPEQAEARALGLAVTAFDLALGKAAENAIYTDLIGRAVASIRDGERRRLERILARAKGAYLRAHLQRAVDAAIRAVEAFESDLRASARAIEILGEWSFDPETRPEPQTPPRSTPYFIGADWAGLDGDGWSGS